jgi:Gpi18-like mannosyltransferase
MICKIIKSLVKGEKLGLIGAIIFLFNPVVWYNSAVWGQYDSVINLFALLSLYLLMRKKLTFALLAFALSLYIKASLLIFAPIFLIIAMRQKYSVNKYLTALVVSIIAIAAITLPFSRGEPFSWLFNLYKDRVFVDQLHSITANAYNLWGAVNGIHAAPQLFPESTPFLVLTYQIWSYIIFTIFYIPSLILAFKKQDTKSVVWALAIGAFSSFMLLTNMHERYLYPLFPYFTILVVIVPELFANYAAVSLVSLINMYNFWFVPFILGLAEFMTAKENLASRYLSGINFALFIFFYLRFIRYNFVKKDK